ncbi:MAG: hypothetical protein VB122_07955 [Erysipelotrichales bacterium]|nr:hypothetical protein [Erysipelotrichales bacterium]
MIKLRTDIELNSEDMQVIKFILQIIQIYKVENINHLEKIIDDVQFSNYKFGFGGNHLWIHRKGEDKRICVFVNENFDNK